MTLVRIKGRVVNGGECKGEAIVLTEPFSFIGDFDPETGLLTQQDSPLYGTSIAGKILVCPSGRGGTIAPFIAYLAAQKGNAPKAILCQRVEPLIAESAITINIPILDNFDCDPLKCIETGQQVEILENGEVLIG
jgi:predicted aconitase with swiveling domain